MQRRYRMTVLVMLLLGISMGYALLTSNLNILGVSEILNPTWDIHFENVKVKSGSITASTPTIDTNKTTVSYSVTLNTPGDFYEFTVDAVNAGTIDGMISEISSTLNNVEITNNLPPALEYSITYDDGVALAENQILSAGDSETYKVKVGYKTDIDPEDLPDTEETLNLTLTVTYEQSNKYSRAVNHRSLYSVLKKEATTNGLAREYTGAHHDSFSDEPSKKIYHWYAENDTDGNQVRNKYNVIFAGHCWQMLRTTDTGGVKMIYNGEVRDNKCLSSRGRHSGYRNRSLTTLSGNYWYGSEYVFDGTRYQISGTTEKSTWNENTFPNLVGKYTCKGGSVSGTCTTLYLVESYYDATRGYTIDLKNNDVVFSAIGHQPYNGLSPSIGNVGYMYNTIYQNESLAVEKSEPLLYNTSLSTSYWYADSVEWRSNKYSLVNPYQVSSEEEYSSLIGKYTFRSSSQTYTAKNVSYIADIKDGKMYYITLSNGTNLNDNNYQYAYGDSFTDNGDGTYTINNPTSFYRSESLSQYDYLLNKYICKNPTNNTCSEVWYSYEWYTSMSFYQLEYIIASNNFKYAKSFTYENGQYTLDNNAVSFWDVRDDENIQKINNAHYTCLNNSGVCNKIYFIFEVYSLNSRTYYFVGFSDGKDIDDAINEMLFADDVNKYDSTAKLIVESWYKHYMTEYDSFIEDTIYCNDRTILENISFKDDSDVTSDFSLHLTFKEYNLSNDLLCPRVTDSFSVSNNKASLKYKVGLMSAPEMNILNNDIIRKSGESSYGRSYWLASPYALGDVRLISDGSFGRYTANHATTAVIRPAISLKSGTIYSSGTGTMDDPYVVDTSWN